MFTTFSCPTASPRPQVQALSRPFKCYEFALIHLVPLSQVLHLPRPSKTQDPAGALQSNMRTPAEPTSATVHHGSPDSFTHVRSASPRQLESHDVEVGPDAPILDNPDPSHPAVSSRSFADSLRDLSDSEIDEQLGPDVDGSSLGTGSEIGRPTSGDLCEIPESACRAPCSVASRSGRRVAGLCGKPRTGPAACTRAAHVGRRDQAQPAGFYESIDTGKGLSIHGRADRPHLSWSEYRALQDTERTEMTQVTETLESEEEKDPADLPQRVSFGPTSIFQSGDASRETDMDTLSRLIDETVQERLRGGLAACTDGPLHPLV